MFHAFGTPEGSSRIKFKNNESLYGEATTVTSCEGCPARSKALGSGPSLVEVRGFESHPSH